MSRPRHPDHPRLVELLLQSLAPRSVFREVLLGDLAEEFMLRAERHGRAAARQWYYWEAIRGVPYLLLATCRDFQARDLRELVRAAFTSLLIVTMIGIPLNIIAYGVAWVFNTSINELWRSGSLLLPFLAVGLASAMVGGYTAARLYARAPLLGAAALCALWSNVSLASLLIAHDRLPIWYRIVPVIIIVGTTAGGILRAWTSRDRTLAA